MALSPMMQQYTEIKEQHKDCILFFRLGDFYEMFFEDAITGAKELELTLTGKNCGQEERAPMCGVPFHSADTYIAALVDKGYKVAICEQVEDPAQAKGLVKREVVQIVTPGTVSNGIMLNEKENNYLASVFASDRNMALAYCDISTGELYSVDFPLKRGKETLFNEIAKIAPKEILIPEALLDQIEENEIREVTGAYLNILSDLYFSCEAGRKAILKHFEIKAPEGVGLGDKDEQITALGALFSYLSNTQKNDLSHISKLKIYDIDSRMSLDKTAIRNLEITETLYEKKVQGSLLEVLDKTNTAMGSRKMKKWLREPLNRADEINKRLDAVQLLYDDLLLRNNLRQYLKQVYDLERLGGRIACGNANGRDLIALKNSLSALPDLKHDLCDCESALLTELEARIDPLAELCSAIDTAIEDDPPFTIKEGKLIKTGYSADLDELKFSVKDAQLWIANLEESERVRTGIRNLKVGFNKVFGYYLEVTKSFYDAIPENYIRKQTLSNCERFITPELKDMESLVLNAETKINKMEYELFTELRQRAAAHIVAIQETAEAISSLDVLLSFAEVSANLSYVKPEVNEESEIYIKNGRHPVIEQMCTGGTFVSNDTYIDADTSSLLLITGPNMSGKSTYMRQTALIVLMAQAGCFVPCDTAKIGIADRIFTRIGASDNLTQGQSTFFVEMSELACILNTATEKSLVILDEIGRGTSTYDGLSIAWAAAEHLCSPQRKIRTLFATHYHELTVLEESLPGLRNLNVDVSEEDGNAVFLHKIIEGSASRSYGIHVAKLAGVPKSVLTRAREKLGELENEAHHTYTSACREQTQQEQLSLFSFAPNPVIEKLKSLNLMEITPSKAIALLEELQQSARKE